MPAGVNVDRRCQFCARCGQLMFEYYRSPDGHYGLVDEVGASAGDGGSYVRCPICDTRYRLLECLDPFGRPVERR